MRFVGLKPVMPKLQRFEQSKWDALAVELVSFMGGTKGYQGI